MKSLKQINLELPHWATKSSGKIQEKFKLETTPTKANISMLNSNISYPFIAHVNKDSGLLHYIVVLKKEKIHCLLRREHILI